MFLTLIKAHHIWSTTAKPVVLCWAPCLRFLRFTVPVYHFLNRTYVMFISKLNNFFSLHYFVFTNGECLLSSCPWLCSFLCALLSNVTTNYISSHHTDPRNGQVFRLTMAWPLYSHCSNSWFWPSENETWPSSMLFEKESVVFLLFCTAFLFALLLLSILPYHSSFSVDGC